MDSNNKLNLPPFPLLTWDHFFWRGELTLFAWSGFQTRRGPYCSLSDENPSSGCVRISVEPPNENELPTQEQMAAMQFLLDNQDALKEKILLAIFKIYPDERDMFRSGYGFDDSMDEEEKAEFEEEYGRFVPELSKTAELANVIGLSQVHILSRSENGLAFVGFEFGCNWDEEHGCGVLTHNGQVLEVGGADVSFR